MSFINTIINSNRHGFKNPARKHGLDREMLHPKGDKPKKHENGTVSFFEENIKSDSPTQFNESTINNSAWKLKAKEFKYFSAKADPFKKLFGYQKQIQPLHSINPKYYQFDLKNKSYDDMVKDTLAAEHGTFVNDVENREAFRDFLTLKKIQDARDAEEVKEETTLEPDLALEPTPSTSPRSRSRSSSHASDIAVEPIRPTAFQEFEEKTQLGPTLSDKEVKKLVKDAKAYANHQTNDRSSLIKLNKVMDGWGCQELLGRKKIRN